MFNARFLTFVHRTRTEIVEQRLKKSRVQMRIVLRVENQRSYARQPEIMRTGVELTRGEEEKTFSSTVDFYLIRIFG